MSTDVTPWATPVELAIKALILSRFADATEIVDETERDGRVGGDFAFEGGEDWYIRIGLVDSNSDRFGGSFVFDLETWGDDWADTDSRANRLDALVLGYPHVVEVDDQTWVFDTVSQNTGPRELPWEDDAVTRLGATYVITARRR